MRKKVFGILWNYRGWQSHLRIKPIYNTFEMFIQIWIKMCIYFLKINILHMAACGVFRYIFLDCLNIKTSAMSGCSFWGNCKSIGDHIWGFHIYLFPGWGLFIPRMRIDDWEIKSNRLKPQLQVKLSLKAESALISVNPATSPLPDMRAVISKDLLASFPSCFKREFNLSAYSTIWFSLYVLKYTQWVIGLYTKW